MPKVEPEVAVAQAARMAPPVARAPEAPVTPEDSLVDPLADSELRGWDRLKQGSGQAFLQAKVHHNLADRALEQSQNASAHGRRDGVFETVLRRNQELKALTRASAYADVSTERDGGVLWSGDKKKGDDTLADAMPTAQSFAKAHGRKTVEMTDGGRTMDSYTNEKGNSFDDIADRFIYMGQGDLNQPKGEETQEAKKSRLRRSPERTAMMQAELAKHQADPALSGHQVSQDSSAAGALWDVMSKRFASGLSGDVMGVHAYGQADHGWLNDPATGPLRNNTMNNVEKPAVEAAGKATIVDLFGDDVEVAKHLKKFEP